MTKFAVEPVSCCFRLRGSYFFFPRFIHLDVPGLDERD